MTESVDTVLELRVALERARRAREAHAELRASWDDAQAQFREQNRPLIEAVALAERDVREAEVGVRQRAIDEYKRRSADGEPSKQLTPGCSIREEVQIDYHPDSAREWCIERALFLGFDSKSFEAHIRREAAAGRPVPTFVDVTTRIVATIAREIPSQAGVGEIEAAIAARPPCFYCGDTRLDDATGEPCPVCDGERA